MGSAVDSAFKAAAHVVRLDTTINRITGVPLEPRAVVASFTDGRYTIHSPTGSAQRFRADAAAALGVPESAVRFVAREVGGSYGTRNYLCPEIPLVAWAAKRLGRPVKWRADRQECFLSDDHARALSVAGRARARQGRQLPRLPLRQHQRRRRLSVLLHPAHQGCGRGDLGLPLARRRVPRTRPELEHHGDLALPRGRAPRGHVRDRAPDRPRRAQARLRSRRARGRKISFAHFPIGTTRGSSTTAATIRPCKPARTRVGGVVHV